MLDEASRQTTSRPCYFVDDEGHPTEQYPFNPNGSIAGITALCSPDGRHLALMPHPERSFLTWQWPLDAGTLEALRCRPRPGCSMFQNARAWCDSVGVGSR